MALSQGVVCRHLYNKLSPLCFRFVSTTWRKHGEMQPSYKRGKKNSFSESFFRKCHPKSIIFSKLQWVVGPEDLKQYFSQYGKIDYMRFPFDSEGFPCSWAEIKFVDDKSIEEVAKNCPHYVDEAKIKIHFPNIRTTNQDNMELPFRE